MTNIRGRDTPLASSGHVYPTHRIDMSQWNMRRESSLHAVVSPGNGTHGVTHDAVCSRMGTLPLAKWSQEKRPLYICLSAHRGAGE